MKPVYSTVTDRVPSSILHHNKVVPMTHNSNNIFTSPDLELQLQHTVCAGVGGQVELVLLLQGRGDKAPPQVVVSTPEVGG